MSNPLYMAMQGRQGAPNGLLQRLNQLKSTFKGDPNVQIQKMLNSGQVTQAQYDRAIQQAQQIQKMLGY